MMETYAERLQREKEKKMTNYDMDELRRRGEVPDLEKRRKFAEDIIESEKGNTQYTHEQMITREKKSRGIVQEDKELEGAVTVELPDSLILKLALQAHERDITLNKMCPIVLRDSFTDLEYRYEHQSKPQVLKEY